MFSFHLRKIQITFLSLGSLATYSCTDPELVSLPFSGPKMVLHVIGVTTNDSTFVYNNIPEGWNLETSLSYPALFPQGLPCDFLRTWNPVVEIANATHTSIVDTVWIQEGCVAIYIDHGRNRLIPPLESGKNYQITGYDNHGRSVRGQYTHPPLVAIKILKADYIGPGVLDEWWTGFFYEITLEIEDPNDEINFYGLSMAYFSRRLNFDFTQSLHFDLNDPAFNDLAFNQSGTAFPTGDDWLFDDGRLNTLKKTITLKAFLHDSNITDEAPTEEYLAIYLRNYSPELYQFYHDLHIQSLAEQDRNSTPMPIRSNVEDGLGVVGGYAEYRHMIPVEFYKNR